MPFGPGVVHVQRPLAGPYTPEHHVCIIGAAAGELSASVCHPVQYGTSTVRVMSDEAG